MASYCEVIDSFAWEGGVFAGVVADNWLQGRTLYGGMTAALCLEGALAAFPDAPALRTAQISFLGPPEGALKITPCALRQGKSVTFVNVDLAGEKGLAARAVFAFGAARQSMFAAHFAPAPFVPGPDKAAMFFPLDEGPLFARNFEVRLAKGALPLTGSTEHDHFLWVRHRERKATSLAALLALADLPPPAVFPMFPKFAPISTMSWSFNLLTDHPVTDDGWWLLESRAENAAGGYSSQDMFVWSGRGEPVLAGRQSVAIFL